MKDYCKTNGISTITCLFLSKHTHLMRFQRARNIAMFQVVKCRFFSWRHMLRCSIAGSCSSFITVTRVLDLLWEDLVNIAKHLVEPCFSERCIDIPA